MERCFQLSMFCVYIFPAKVLHWFVVAREDFSLEGFGFSMFLSCSYLANIGGSVNIQKKKNQGSRIKVTLNQTLSENELIRSASLTPAAVLLLDLVKSTRRGCIRIGAGLLPSSGTLSQNRGSCYQMVKQTHWPAAHNSNPLSTLLSACLSLVDQLSNLWRVQTKGERKDGRRGGKRMWLGEKVHGVCLILIIETIHPR